MYYHFAILLLFRPFIKLSLIGSSVSPRDVCSQAADAISALVNSYSKLYTLQRTPSFVPYFVLTAAITHLIDLGHSKSSGPDKFLQGIQDLDVMTSCHGFAYRSRDILRYLAHNWGIKVTEDDNMDFKDLKTLCRPSTTSLNFFAVHIEPEDMTRGIGPAHSEDEDPLFWPFPMQGRPLVELGPPLEKAGFALTQSPPG